MTTNDDSMATAPPDLATWCLHRHEADVRDMAGHHNRTVRVVQRNGESFAITMDYHSDRLNVSVVDDRVTDAYWG